MVGGRKLSSVEQRQIYVLRQQKLLLRAIAATIGRSKTAVANFLKGLNTYSAKKRKGKARKLSERDRRAITPLLSQRISAWTVRRDLQRNDNTKYVKRSAKPKLKSHRVAWVRTQIRERTVWEKVIFSDEKKFSLDGPDGLQFYWRNPVSLRLAPRKWRFCLADKTFDYDQTLTIHLFPLADEWMSGSYIFQHGNASIHSSAATRAFLNNLNIPVLPWPSLSPDLNSIENLWGDMARAVYSGGKQCTTTSELTYTILRAWRDIPTSRLEKLANSMHERCMDVLERRGGKIAY